MQLLRVPSHILDMLRQLVHGLPDGHPHKEEAMTTLETPEPQDVPAAAEAAEPTAPETAAEAAPAAEAAAAAEPAAE